MSVFDTDDDYAAFERTLAQAVERRPTARLLAYCLMPNHWHLVLWPRQDDDVSEFMRWLTVTHTQRWHAAHHSAGTGPVYQGRFKSFPIERDAHLHNVIRYVEQNALRAHLVKRAENWVWSSLWHWEQRGAATTADSEIPQLSAWPGGDRPRGWSRLVNQPFPQREAEAIERSIRRSAPYGKALWVQRTAAKLDLESTLRPPGRPKLER